MLVAHKPLDCEQAKQWHPDRNLDAVEEATKRFKAINSAFDTLSDDQERAWYDAHRHAILRGIDPSTWQQSNGQSRGQGSGHGDGRDPDIDLIPFLSPFAFDGFGDDDNGFYAVYRSVFDRIIEIESFSVRKTPKFGSSESGQSAVCSFYSFWEHLNSRRTFKWMTRYNLSNATNRKMRGLMHRENRKLVESAKREWEETVSKLVAFIKRRDPRWKQYLEQKERRQREERRKEKAMKREIDRIMREELQRQREQQMERRKQSVSGSESDLESASASASGSGSDSRPSDQEVIEERFECVVCDKVFKSENAFISHQKTRKHLRAKEALRMALDLEDELLFNDDADNDNEGDQKQNEQQKVDGLIAQQLAHRLNVENIESLSDDDEAVENENENAVDDQTKNDYLIAVEMEQEAIIEAVADGDDHLFDAVGDRSSPQNVVDHIDHNDIGNGNDNGNGDGNGNGQKPGISENEILSLLQDPEVDLESLLISYPELTAESILEIQSKAMAQRTGRSLKRKKKRKQRERLFDGEDDGNQMDDEQRSDEFLKRITSFNTKSGRRGQRRQNGKDKGQRIDDGAAEESAKKKKTKKRRRRRDKDSKPQHGANGKANGNGQAPRTAPIRSECKACHQLFGSKTKLFEHLKLFPKHALISSHGAR